jgi:hypothetical protein
VSYSDILASTALGVSLLTAGWTALRTWCWDRPVVLVSGQQWVGGLNTTPGRRIAGFSLEVVNTGNQTTQIIAAYWQIDRGNGVDIHFTASHGGGGVDSLFDAPDHAQCGFRSCMRADYRCVRLRIPFISVSPQELHRDIGSRRGFPY